MWQAYHRSHREQNKCERYRQEQRALLRKLGDLAASERTMYDLEQAKDQVMSVLKLALTNLVMWARDHYFPATYAHATWHRLWRVDRHEGDELLATTIDGGETEQHRLYLGLDPNGQPFEHIEPSRLDLPEFIQGAVRCFFWGDELQQHQA